MPLGDQTFVFDEAFIRAEAGDMVNIVMNDTRQAHTSYKRGYDPCK